MLSQQFEEELAQIKVRVIDAIIDAIKKVNAFEIRLDNPICLKYIDDQFNETISLINIETNRVNIDCNGMYDDYDMIIDDLSIEFLLDILNEIEIENFEIEELNGE